MKLFKDFNLGLSWYLANTFNQTFDPQISVSSGYTTIYLQTGYVRNTGLELSLGYGHTWNNNFRWDSNFTLSHNKNKIKELVRDYVHPETGELINKDRLDVGGLGKARFILKEGGTLGDLYTQSDLKRDDNRMVDIDPIGMEQSLLMERYKLKRSLYGTYRWHCLLCHRSSHGPVRCI